MSKSETPRTDDALNVLLNMIHESQHLATIEACIAIKEVEREGNHYLNIAQKNLEELTAARAELKAVTEQRDRLAEAVNAATILIAAKGRHNTMLAYNGLRDALQSLTTNVNVLAPAGEKTPTKQENE
jgi:hypothetical protein